MTGKIITFLAMVILVTGVSYSAAERVEGQASKNHSGVVLDTMSAGTYTYIKVDENGNRFWVAAPRTAVAKGTRVGFTEEVWITNFESKALKQTFDKILFVNGIGTGSSPSVLSGLSLLKPKTKEDPGKTPVKLPPNPDGDYTIEEIFSRKEDLKDTIVKIHGNVVKVSRNIMGRNWVHIEDGTSFEGNKKIIFTSNNAASVGETLTAQGTLAVDKDFGYGYFYPVIVQESTFTKHSKK